MVQPERLPGEETRRTSAPRAAFVVATIVFVIATAFGLGRLTAPSPEGAVPASTTTTAPSLFQPTTTTTIDFDDFRVADIATGRPLRWVRGTGIGSDVPLALVNHADRLLMFTHPDPSTGVEGPGGLNLWATDEGVFWLDQGEVIGAEYSVQQVVSTDDGLIALATERATGSAAVLTSTDALTWSIELLPAPRELQPGERFELRPAVAQAGNTIVFGSIEKDEFEGLYEYLPDDITSIAREYGLSWDGPPYRLWIHAPWGIAGYVATAEELGVPDDVMARLNSVERPELYVWTLAPGDGWTVANFEATWIESATIAGEGAFTVHGNRTSGPGIWVSNDGISWKMMDTSGWMTSIVRSPQGLAAIDYSNSRPAVALSADGIEWTDAGVPEMLSSSLDWDLEWLAGSDSGLALLARGFPRFGIPDVAAPVASLRRNGYEMNLDLETGGVEVNDAETGANLLRLQAWGKGETPGIEVDFAARTITLLDDPDEGNPLVSFGFDEMLAAERAAWATTFPATTGFEAFLFSPDGTQWSIQDMADVMVGDVIVEMLVADDRILVVSVDRLALDTVSPTFRTWLGMVPSG